MELPPAPALCWGCSAGIEGSDRYCRRCGLGQGDYIAWYYQPWGIALATLLALGPLGIALVWRTPRLGRNARWAWTAGILVLTAYSLLGLYRTVIKLQSLAEGYAQRLMGLGF